LAALLALVDLRRLWATVAGADGPLLGAALAVACAAIVFLEARRFQAVFASRGLGYGAALRITLASLFVGSFTPGAVGAELYKLYWLHRRERGMVRPFVQLALLRVVGAAAVVIVAGGAVLAAPARVGEIASRIAWRWPAGTTTILATAGALLAALGLVVLALGWTRLALRLREVWRQGREGLAGVRVWLMGELFVLSLGVALLRGLSLALLVRSLGASARFGDLLVVVALSVLAGVLPIGPAGLGLQEGVLAGCLVLLRIPPPVAVAIALLSRVFLWIFAAGGLWALSVAGAAPPAPLAGGSRFKSP
jgi:uncharacterized membrane protein YbhN (UPF0104 family)